MSVSKISTAALTLVLLGVSAPAFAEGDAKKGEKAFKRCQACHQIVDDSGTVLGGKKGKSGPNLYDIIGATAGTNEDFGKKYGKSLVAAGEDGLVWDVENIAEYMTDPKKFLATYLNDKKAKSKMAHKQRKGQADIAAYLESFKRDDS